MHEHKIVEIKERHVINRDYEAVWMMMDCPVMPEKVVVARRSLSVGDVFDPHFSNENVVGRFPPSEYGFDLACDLLT